MRKIKVTVRDIEKIIADNLCDKNLTLYMIGELAECSSGTAENLIYMEYGITIKKYITNKRLEKALIMISKGTTVKKVCRLCGFGHIRTLYRNFKQKFGITTTEFREKYLEDNSLLEIYIKEE